MKKINSKDSPLIDHRISPWDMFFSVYLSFQLISIFMIFISHGSLSGNIIWSGPSTAVFPDFVETLWQGYGLNPYETGAIYPAIVYVLCDILMCMLPISIVGSVDQGIIQYNNWPQASFTPEVHCLSTVFFILCLILLYIILKNALDRYEISPKKQKQFFWCIFTSVPLIFSLERGNLIILVVAFLFIFCLSYKNDSFYLRTLSYICLSLAVGFKIYPVFLGLLILQRRKHRTRETTLCIFIGAAILFLPFVFTGGYSSFEHMLQNIFSHTSNSSNIFGYAHKVNISNTINFVQTLFFTDQQISPIITNITQFIPYMIMMLACIKSFFFKKFWKKCCILIVAFILLPGFSVQYNVFYLTIPVFYFFVDVVRSKNHSSIDYIYAILFVLCTAPMVFGKEDYMSAYDFICKLNLGTIIPSFAIVILFVFLFFDFTNLKGNEK